MACNGGLHGAIYKDFSGECHCLLCGETVNFCALKKLRKEASEKDNYKVLTSKGFIKIEDIKVGDKVITSSGQENAVVRILKRDK